LLCAGAGIAPVILADAELSLNQSEACRNSCGVGSLGTTVMWAERLGPFINKIDAE
jgi:hypothetical protein